MGTRLSVLLSPLYAPSYGLSRHMYIPATNLSEQKGYEIDAALVDDCCSP
jgi:hypothetical protein